MFQAYFRIFRISFFVVALTGFILVGLRGTGLSTKYKAMEHPLIFKDFYLVAKGGELGPKNSSIMFDRTKELSPQIINIIDIQMTKDTELVLYGHETLEEQSDGQGFILQYNLDELKKLNFAHSFNKKNNTNFNSPILTLNEYLEKYGDHKTIINIYEQDPARIFKLIEIIKSKNLSENTVFHSKYPQPIKYIRKEFPRAVFGLATTDLVQGHILSSIFMEPLAKLRGDIVLTTSLLANKQEIHPGLVNEFKRRQMKLIIDDDKGIPNWLDIKLDGIMTSRPEKYLPRLKQSS